jgi:hypothetical protein
MATFKNLTISDTGNLTPPDGTIAEQPAAPVPGQLRYNTTEKVIESYNDIIGEFKHENVTQENIYKSPNLVTWFDAGNRASYPGTGTTVYDLSGNNNNGTLNANVEFTKQNGGAFVFNSGEECNINVPSTSDYNFGTGDYTWEVWNYQKDLPSYSHLVAFPNQGTACLKINRINGNNGTDIYVYNGGPSSYGQTNGWNVGLNVWSHIVVSRRQGRYYMYINGLEVADTTSGAEKDHATEALNIGQGQGTEWTNHNIAVVRIYKGEGLTREQVQQNYYASWGRFGHQGQYRYKQEIPTKGLRTLIDFANPTCYTGYTDYVNDLSPLVNPDYVRGNNGTFLYSTKPQYLYNGAESYHGAVYNGSANGTLALNNVQSFDYVTVAIWFRWNGDSNVEDILFNNENTWEINTNGGAVNMAVYANNQGWFWDDTNGRLDQFYPNFVCQTYDGSAVRHWVNGYHSETYNYPGNGVLNKPGQYTKFWERGGSFSFQDSSDSVHSIYQIMIYDRALDDWEVKQLWELGATKFYDSPR